MSDRLCCCNLLLLVLMLQLFASGCNNAQLEAQRKEAQSQVSRWADKLDGQTTETGAYVRPKKTELPEKDPWDASLTVAYSQGGTAEVLVVRSVGPDGMSHTEDDITAQRSTVNLKGIGEGIKKNASKIAEETSKGAVRGLIRGAKEGVKEAFQKKEKGDERKSGDEENE